MAGSPTSSRAVECGEPILGVRAALAQSVERLTLKEDSVEEPGYSETADNPQDDVSLTVAVSPPERSRLKNSVTAAAQKNHQKSRWTALVIASIL